MSTKWVQWIVGTLLSALAFVVSTAFILHINKPAHTESLANVAVIQERMTERAKDIEEIKKTQEKLVTDVNKITSTLHNIDESFNGKLQVIDEKLDLIWQLQVPAYMSEISPEEYADNKVGG